MGAEASGKCSAQLVAGVAEAKALARSNREIACAPLMAVPSAALAYDIIAQAKFELDLPFC